MTDPAPTPPLSLVERFAALVALMSSSPQSAMEHRDLARTVVESAKKKAAALAFVDGALVVDGGPAHEGLSDLAARLTKCGVLELAITDRAALADVLDLARMLATVPGESDPPSKFAARSAVLDARAFPRKLVPRTTALPDALYTPPKRTSGTSPIVEGGSAPRPKPIVEGASAPRPKPIVEAASAPAPKPVTEGPSAPRPSSLTPARGSIGTPSQGINAFTAINPATPSPQSELIEEPIEMPVPSHPALAAAMDVMELADSRVAFVAALDQFVLLCDLAFRQGRFDDLIEAMIALVAIEQQQNEMYNSDDRRQAFSYALRRLADRTVVVRQIAVLRHERWDDPVASARLQTILTRLGADGAEAMIDEYVASKTAETRARCLEALRGLRRTHDALLALARDTRDLMVRQAAAILGELRDPRGETILLELIHHPDARARRAAVRALGQFDSLMAFDAIGLALEDESPLVRHRAVATVAAKKSPKGLALLMPVLEKEKDREVLYSAISAVGAIGSPEAAQVLIKMAEGEGAHPQRKSAALRIQACTALVAIRSPQTMTAVQALRNDRDREVREASVRLVAQAQRRSTATGMQAIIAP
ncbi:MAG: HEAT repeat domain-containing protein [Gemmatimonadaceae bacterium]|nr:HEAT repeat domain-containing protein [Gemmatimonadaceae bacterium]